MKTKLLKIVRKRYSINKYTHIDDPNHCLYKQNFPVWAYSEYGSIITVYQSYDGAYDHLVKQIRRHYYYTKKRITFKPEHVWYNKNINK